jgi:hypothetical protein
MLKSRGSLMAGITEHVRQAVYIHLLADFRRAGINLSNLRSEAGGEAQYKTNGRPCSAMAV